MVAAALLVAAAAAAVHGGMTEDAWRALVAANAAANPHATFSHEGGVPEFYRQPRKPLAPLSGVSNAAAWSDVFEVDYILRNVEAPPAIDWREKGAVTSVKNQGHYGTCWSFAATENLEGLNVRQGNKLQNVSNQELIDCCKGCQGSRGDTSFDYLLNNTGGQINLLKEYPYNGAVGKCLTDAAGQVKSTVQLSKHGRIYDDGTGKPIVAGIFKYGPMGTGVDASCFGGYKGGVITNCTSPNIDHAVLIVAVGTDKDANADYYTIKNSWSTNFGEDGYVRIARGTPVQGGIHSTIWTQ